MYLILGVQQLIAKASDAAEAARDIALAFGTDSPSERTVSTGNSAIFIKRAEVVATRTGFLVRFVIFDHFAKFPWVLPLNRPTPARKVLGSPGYSEAFPWVDRWFTIMPSSRPILHALLSSRPLVPFDSLGSPEPWANMFYLFNSSRYFVSSEHSKITRGQGDEFRTSRLCVQLEIYYNHVNETPCTSGRN
ncbi:hypothetical protein Y032_0169g225 [Ancylostoma ceylanicum]|nr:hypothetical protein Y032_0169g225 [Ancylostoma ceylanicum]